MKKLILPIIVCLLTLTTVNANANNINDVENRIEDTRFYNISAFCKLIQVGNYEAIKSLIEMGENVNEKSNGMTPLMFAARHNRAKIAELLIKNGAKIKTRSDKGNLTALKVAERSKAKDVYKVIKQALKK